MRKKWQIATSEKVYSQLSTKKRVLGDERAMRQFNKPVKERIKPEELLIRLIAS
jgi:hypothetical protein